MRLWEEVRSSPISTGTPTGMKPITEKFSKRALPYEGRRDIYLVEGKAGLALSD